VPEEQKQQVEQNVLGGCEAVAMIMLQNSQSASLIAQLGQEVDRQRLQTEELNQVCADKANDVIKLELANKTLSKSLDKAIERERCIVSSASETNKAFDASKSENILLKNRAYDLENDIAQLKGVMAECGIGSKYGEEQIAKHEEVTKEKKIDSTEIEMCRTKTKTGPKSNVLPISPNFAEKKTEEVPEENKFGDPVPE
jgi:hypothetical protein